MVYCCCTWKLLMSLKYTHYHANPPYFFLGGTSDSVSAYIHLVVFAQLLVSRLLLLVQGQVSLYQYSCLWKCMGYCWNMGSLTNTFTTNAIPLIRSGSLSSFFSFRYFFSPPPHQFTGAAEDSCASQWCMGPAYSPKKTVASMCVYIW